MICSFLVNFSRLVLLFLALVQMIFKNFSILKLLGDLILLSNKRVSFAESY